MNHTHNSAHIMFYPLNKEELYLRSHYKFLYFYNGRLQNEMNWGLDEQAPTFSEYVRSNYEFAWKGSYFRIDKDDSIIEFHKGPEKSQT